MDGRPRSGDVLWSPAFDARLLVIDPGTAAGMPTIDDVPLVRGRPQPCSKAAGPSGLCQLQGGGRYIDVPTGLTLLCVWPGQGSLRYEGRPLVSNPDPQARADRSPSPWPAVPGQVHRQARSRPVPVHGAIT
jgi:hypothetical protein